MIILKKCNIIVLDSETLCPFRQLQPESVQHLFLSCGVVSNIWNKCYSWISLNFGTVNPAMLEGHFWHITGLGRSKYELEVWKSIWSNVLLCIWNKRNKCIFQQALVDWKLMMDELKFTAWSSLYNKYSSFKYSFVQWNYNTSTCLIG